MIVLFLAIVFTIHAIVFFRVYTRNPHRIHLLLTISGFIHLAMFYGYRTYVYFEHPEVYLDWIQYLRWSGAAMSIIGLPPLLRSLYLKVRGRMIARRAAAGEGQGPTA